ncbi:thioesterase family protein [Sphingomonas sp.]|uniref:acyl-CoA thioesterase n=1 Tax=Sphingomonas sp. TaxID=28214 RepID=UPI000DB7A12D|nr:thioesterase family protein [Sphingomonas sp.]PZU06388.1 MAG: thioesterase [Sphingomonas sp.]
MTFVSRQKVRFAHVDPAGIVFYPRYFEMLNAAIEDFFADHVGVDFRRMHLDRRLGVPTVKLETIFSAPSRLGDLLSFEIEVARTGQTSADLRIDVMCADEHRLQISVVLVCMNLNTGRPVEWPADMRLGEMARA